MNKAQEHEFYSRPENQEPQGPPVRRKSKYGAPVPVRFPQPLLDRIRDAAEKDDRSVSSWIRRAAEHELGREAG